MFSRSASSLCYLLVCFLNPWSPAWAQIDIEVDFTTERAIGGSSQLDRSAYFNLHQGRSLNEFSAAERKYLFEDLRIGDGGREFSGAGTLEADLGNLPDEATMRARGESYLQKQPVLKDLRQMGGVISTDHPRRVFSMEVDPERLAQHTTHYFNYYFGKNKPLPAYYEPINEPFVHAGEFGKNSDEVISRMCQYHALLADKMHQQVPGVKIVGYASAWPEYDFKDFTIWEQRMKQFMDVAGEKMDYLSVHLYDGMNLEGSIAKRSGSNSEAILDLIETYSFIKWGYVKPMMISEFGITGKGWSDRYLEARNALTVNSIHNLTMGIMERPEVIKRAVPFITGKSQWYLNSHPGQPYQWVILRPSANDSGWEFTSLAGYYDMWKNVEGTRAWTQSSDPDVATAAFVSKGKAFLVLKNLEDDSPKIQLKALKGNMRIKGITQKVWYMNPDSSVNYQTTEIREIPAEIDMPKAGMILFEIAYDAPNAEVFQQKLNQTKYYSQTYLQPVKKGTPLTFEINGVNQKAEKAYLRLALSRNHDLSLKPKVTLNGKPLKVPDDWAGYDQKSRHSFFGSLVIPVDGTLVQQDNVAQITFDDADGGRVSSVVLVAVSKEK
ncbi:hypothetical protein [Persicitalea jodogahamensis]|uniref:Beta-agarase n=1 Tax=Persicitalea jodogahamensis TaxID=402147 RepID=A0A8J3D2W4_9BACT|nr:hypothetical protein [Persicitalea jodogahamensis]GHB63663.1 hypothetical protein GCM10007390_16870 [Persicitalea jodogahamensis]